MCCTQDSNWEEPALPLVWHWEPLEILFPSLTCADWGFPARVGRHMCNVKTSLECHRDYNPALLTSQGILSDYETMRGGPAEWEAGGRGLKFPPCLWTLLGCQLMSPSLSFPMVKWESFLLWWHQRDAMKRWRKLLGGCTWKTLGLFTNTGVVVMIITACQWESGLSTECASARKIISIDKCV